MQSRFATLAAVAAFVGFGWIGSAVGADPSLGLFMSFDQMKGDLVPDLSGNDNNGAVEGNVPLSSGKYGKAAEFAGNTTDKILIPQSATLDPKDGKMTAACWVNPTALNEWELVMLKWQDDGPAAFSYHFSLHNGGISMYFSVANGGWLESKGRSLLKLDQWSHIAAVADGSRLVVYLNGVEDGSVAYDGTVAVTDARLCIGGKYAGALFPFHGLVDDVVFFNRALSADEVNGLMDGVADWLAVEPDGRLATTWASVKQTTD